MPHQTPEAANAATQNSATGQQPANTQAREQHVTASPEPRSYAAPDAADATLAGPAAGEVADYMDEGDPSLGAQQGRNNTNRELHAQTLNHAQQGPKTRAANKRMMSGEGGPGGGGGR